MCPNELYKEKIINMANFYTNAMKFTGNAF